MNPQTTQKSIFLEQKIPQCGSQEQIYYQKSSEDNQNEYISQFLNNHGSGNIQQIISSNQEQLKKSNDAIQEEISIYNMDNKQNALGMKKRQKSRFHNFQKHLVITLRNIVKVKKSTQPKQNETIAYQMWGVFAKSSHYSKKFLYVLFGVYGNNDENEFSKSFLSKLGFMEIFAKYSQEKIKSAQKYLRKEIISQLQKLNIQKYLHYRKLKRVKQFKNYLEEFIQELQQGSVRKRLPKERRIEMIKLIQKNQGSPETSIGL